VNGDLQLTILMSINSSGITGTLVALISTRMMAAVLPEASITPENLATLDSAASCFLQCQNMLLLFSVLLFQKQR
jgi:hypothetical protein